MVRPDKFGFGGYYSPAGFTCAKRSTITASLKGRGVDFVETGLTVAGHLVTLSHLICDEYVEFDERDSCVVYQETAVIAALLE